MLDRYMENKSILPFSYIDYIEANPSGWEGDLGEDVGYVIIWAKDTILERRDAYEMDTYLSDRWFPFGSDGGGEMLCFDLEAQGDAVYHLPYIGMSEETAMLLCDSFIHLTQRIEGV